MPVGTRSRRDRSPVLASDLHSPVGAYESRPGRYVFIEDGNTDAWIATDHVVEPRP